MARYGFDDLRRFAAALGTACGLAPLRALAMASHLLWFDAAGAATLGIASLPAWLEAIEGGQVDPKAVGRVVGQRSALAIFDGENGLPHLVLERAAELAVETARETAVGLVRVDHVGPIGSAAAIAAGIALGPMAGLVLGPNRLWSMGLPSEAGLPVVVDSGLANAAGAGKPADSAEADGLATDGIGFRDRSPRRSPARHRSAHSGRRLAGRGGLGRGRGAAWRRSTSGSPPPGTGWTRPPAGSSPTPGRRVVARSSCAASRSPNRPGSPSTNGPSASPSRSPARSLR